MTSRVALGDWGFSGQVLREDKAGRDSRMTGESTRNEEPWEPEGRGHTRQTSLSGEGGETRTVLRRARLPAVSAGERRAHGQDGWRSQERVRFARGTVLGVQVSPAALVGVGGSWSHGGARECWS